MQLGWQFKTPKRPRTPRRGRPRKYARGDSRHTKRPPLDPRTPVHITMRLAPAIRSARKFGLHRAIARATITAAISANARIVHFSIQKTHLHAIVEADSAKALSRGLQGFQVSAAKRMNAVLRRSGPVFVDRFHARYLRTPTQTRHAIRYVLLNWRHHGLDRDGPLAGCRVDPFSSAPMFGGFTDYNTDQLVHIKRWPRTYDPLMVFYPRTWLLQRGWEERGGGAFSVWDTPGRLS